MDLLTGYVREKQAALVVVTHDAELLAQLDRVVNVAGWTS